MAAVVIKGAVGEKPKPGNKTFNDPKDVQEVQQLLNKAYGRTVVPPIGKCGFETVNAIVQFQKLWGTPDGSVWPDGNTLKRLNRMATPLTLNPITLERISKGGYAISYQTSDHGELPNQGYRVYVSVGNDAMLLDITGRDRKDVIGPDNLPDLLTLIANQNLWAQPVQCRLTVKLEGHTVTRSDPPQNLKAPVKPYTGKLGPELLKEANVGDWTYGANDPKGLDGRYLWMTPFNGSYYFAYASKFETEPKLRGLVCITYLGAVYGIGATESVKNDWGFKDDEGNVMDRVNVMSAYGTQLAVHLGAQRVDMEAKKAKDIKEFFKKHPKGNYMMWKEGHTVLVIDGKVHEFTNARGQAKGYHQSDAVNETTPALEYGYGNSTWWIRELKAPPS